MRLSLIINPAASSVSARSRVIIQKGLSSKHELTVHETSRQGHATRLAHRSMKEGADVVVTLGGDGTVNEAVNGLLGTSTAVAPLPGGSTNVFARAIGYPNNAVEATKVLLASLETPETRARSISPGSVGIANDRAFVFHVGAGFDAAVVTRVERRSPLKKYAGHPWFIASAIATLTSEQQRQLSLAVRTDDGRLLTDAKMAVALNVNPYTFLGNTPISLAPEAGLDQPLSLVATTSLALTKVLPGISSTLRRSTQGLPSSGPFAHWPGVQGAYITSTQPFTYQLDGEPMPPVTSLRLANRPTAVRFVLPLAD
ncbi:MAG: diacylglycerol kinase family protein [Acidimicrobiales bacterium]